LYSILLFCKLGVSLLFFWIKIVSELGFGYAKNSNSSSPPPPPRVQSTNSTSKPNH
jgi:hypothetical protein